MSETEVYRKLRDAREAVCAIEHPTEVYRKLMDAREAVCAIEHPTKRFHAKLEIDVLIYRYNTSRRWWNKRIKYIGEE